MCPLLVMRTLYHGSNRKFTKLLKSKLSFPKAASLVEDRTSGELYARNKVSALGGKPWLYTFIIDDTNEEQVRFFSDKTVGFVGWILVADELTPQAREKLN